MKEKQCLEPERFHDPSGRRLVAVPLAPDGRRKAILEADDFDAAVAAGLRLPWFLNAGAGGRAYVRAWTRRPDRRLVSVARAILGAGPNQAVRYLGGNRLDLRRENLAVMPVRGKWARRSDIELCRERMAPSRVPEMTA